MEVNSQSFTARPLYLGKRDRGTHWMGWGPKTLCFLVEIRETVGTCTVVLNTDSTLKNSLLMADI
jgi:hypothetical protein